MPGPRPCSSFESRRLEFCKNAAALMCARLRFRVHQDTIEVQDEDVGGPRCRCCDCSPAADSCLAGCCRAAAAVM